MQNNIFLGLFVGHNTVTLKAVDSTNSWLKQAVSKSAPLPEGTVIMAESQFAGRGQSQNTWHSEPGKNLTFSILLNPRFLPIQNQFDLNMAVSLAVNDVLKIYFGEDAYIKWPNDSYIGKNKIGGILIENILQGTQLKHAIIGIGINVNQDDFPPEVKNVTSFRKILHTYYDLNQLKNEICRSVEARYLQLKAGKKESLRKDYLDNLYLLNQQASYIFRDREVEGRITGISPEGFLLLETAEGVEQFGLKEIEFKRED
ncbi:biotin--[acetyl-CoA-carboxylase] ligase [Flavihumibacter sp. R14]|nr:biotin--[acetyl-CoA-carboxylase] ligase [Flavihumibacter soli]